MLDKNANAGEEGIMLLRIPEARMAARHADWCSQLLATQVYGIRALCCTAESVRITVRATTSQMIAILKQPGIDGIQVNLLHNDGDREDFAVIKPSGALQSSGYQPTEQMVQLKDLTGAVSGFAGIVSRNRGIMDRCAKATSRSSETFWNLNARHRQTRKAPL